MRVKSNKSLSSYFALLSIAGCVYLLKRSSSILIFELFLNSFSSSNYANSSSISISFYASNSCFQYLEVIILLSSISSIFESSESVLISKVFKSKDCIWFCCYSFSLNE